MPALPITPQPLGPPGLITDPVSARAAFAALQQQAAALSLTLRPPPPEPTTCCGRGCNGCVWEGFYAAVAFWQEDAHAALTAAATATPGAKA